MIRRITAFIDATIEHLRNRYMATLTMADKWLGVLLDEMDRQELWKDTMVIFTSDHGHMLGEHGRTGKNLFHAWNEMAQIPLFIHLPGDRAAGERFGTVTQNIDLFPTILDQFGVEDRPAYPVHGRSLLPVLKGEAGRVRDYGIYGWYGQPVNITDGHFTYFCAAENDNSPLYWYGSMLTTFPRYLGAGLPKEAVDCGYYLPWADMPVYRINQAMVDKAMAKLFEKSGMSPDPDIKESKLFCTNSDNGQLCPLKDPELENRFKLALAKALRDHQAPKEQLDRLGLRHLV